MYKLNPQIIIEAAALIADKNGLENLNLASLADKLNVKKPSLYNHINGLPELKLQLAIFGAKELKAEVMQSAVGKSREEAIMSMVLAYRNFALKRPGLYKAILLPPLVQNPGHKSAMTDLANIIRVVLEQYHLSEDDHIYAVRGLRSLLHGFVSLESSGAFSIEKANKEKSFMQIAKAFIRGVTKI